MKGRTARIMRLYQLILIQSFFRILPTIYTLDKQTTMKEDFLHYLWRWQRFDLMDLRTTEGETIQVYQVGEHNTHAGPDFLNAKIQIGDTTWAGNVEIHINGSDWTKHKHQEDKAYQNVILHVVLEDDIPIHHGSGERIPTLELRKRVPSNLLSTYQKLIHNEHWIPCQHHFYTVKDITKTLWLDRLLVERLEQKTRNIQLALERHQFNWELVFYHFLARNFGVKVNGDPFEMLARSLPITVLGKHKDQLFQLEALLFGQAGMLNGEFEDDYPNKLKHEYLFLKKLISQL